MDKFKKQEAINIGRSRLTIGMAYILWDERHKAYLYFQRHHIKQALLRVWTIIKQQNYMETSAWLSILEALIHPIFFNLGRIVTYKDLLNEIGKLKSRQELIKGG
uniref:Uncharacterized protein n=1 Tax=Micrurus spixii TaxID=129469 RepID=A0A2D4MXH0_9SAUR